MGPAPEILVGLVQSRTRCSGFKLPSSDCQEPEAGEPLAQRLTAHRAVCTQPRLRIEHCKLVGNAESLPAPDLLSPSGPAKEAHLVIDVHTAVCTGALGHL
jgi:hypothetical protein